MTTYKNTILKNINLILLFFVFTISLYIGLYLDETISGPGSKADFYHTWNYVIALEKNLLASPEGWTVHTPLHYMFLSFLNRIFDDQNIIRFIICTLSLLVPILFYFNLKLKFPHSNEKIIFLFSLSIFLFPSFRYSAIWANDHISGLIFFLASTLFFIKWEKKRFSSINKELILSIIFLTLAVYTRQYYALIFFYYLFIFLQKLKFTDFLKLNFFIFILSLPGFWLIFNFPSLLKTTFTYKFQNTLLINFSILGFYLIPFFLSYFYFEKSAFSKNKKNIYFSGTLSIILIAILLLIGFTYFETSPNAGGGFFMKISYLFLNDLSFFFLSSLLGAFLILYICFEDNKSILIFTLLVFGFSGYVIFQKYFEPMFIFIFFLLIQSKVTESFFINYKNLVIYYIYIFLYFTSALINDYYKFTLNIQY